MTITIAWSMAIGIILYGSQVDPKPETTPSTLTVVGKLIALLPPAELTGGVFGALVVGLIAALRWRPPANLDNSTPAAS